MLPDELILLIAERLKPVDLLSFSETCIQIFRALKHNQFLDRIKRRYTWLKEGYIPQIRKDNLDGARYLIDEKVKLADNVLLLCAREGSVQMFRILIARNKGRRLKNSQIKQTLIDRVKFYDENKLPCDELRILMTGFRTNTDQYIKTTFISVKVVSDELLNLLQLKTGNYSQSQLTANLIRYVRSHGLEDPGNPKIIRMNEGLRNLWRVRDCGGDPETITFAMLGKLIHFHTVNTFDKNLGSTKKNKN